MNRIIVEPALPIRTRRLELSVPTEADLESYGSILRDADVARFLGGSTSVDTDRKFLSNVIAMIEQHGIGPLLVRELDSGRVIGYAGLVRPMNSEEVLELVCAFPEAHQRAGYGFEASSAVLAWARKHRRERVVAKVSQANAAGLALVAKLGLRRTDTEFDVWGQHLDPGHDEQYYRVEVFELAKGDQTPPDREVP